MEAVMKLQTDGGFQLPLSFRQHAWNQLAVESGYTYDCIKKKTAISDWEEEFQEHECSQPVARWRRPISSQTSRASLSGLRHGKDCDSIATPWASNLEPEGLRPPSERMTPEQGRASSSMPKATPSHGPKRARTDEANASSSSSSSRPPPPHQPEDEPIRASWMEVPIPEGAQEYHSCSSSRTITGVVQFC